MKRCEEGHKNPASGAERGKTDASLPPSLLPIRHRATLPETNTATLTLQTSITQYLKQLNNNEQCLETFIRSLFLTGGDVDAVAIRVGEGENPEVGIRFGDLFQPFVAGTARAERI